MRRNWVPALVCFVLGLPWVWLGLYWSLSQHRTNRDARPVRANVVSSEVTVTREYDSKSKKWDTDHHAVIKFEYELGDRAYRSQRVEHEGEPTDETTCRRLVREHPVGHAFTAWYLPEKPEAAFILRGYSFVPYFITFLGLPFVLTSLAVVTGTAQGKGDPEPPERRKAVVYGLIAVLWYGMIVFAVVHFFVIARQPLTAWRAVPVVVVAVLGLIPAKAAWRAHKRAGAPREFAPRWE